MSLTCTAPWTGVFVWTEGTVSYCGRLRASGDLRRQTFEEFWNSVPVQRARSLFLQDGQIESGCPATCCWLTARHPETYVKYFDGGPASKELVPQLRPAQPRPHAPRSYDENQARIAQEIATGPTEASCFPTSLSVSLTTYCSLRCPMCCFGIIPPEQKKPTAKFIDPIVLERLKVVYPYLLQLDLVGGELFDIPFEDNPLVRVLEDVAEAKPTDLHITITTNGQHLSKTWAEFLMRFPFINIVAFSIDSFDPDVYARTRVMGSLERVRRSIGNLQEARAATYGRKRKPEIHLNSILGVHTHDGVPTFVENARALGADEVFFQKLVLMGHPQFFSENNLFQPHHADKLVRLRADLVAAEFKSNRAEIIGMIDAYLGHLGIVVEPFTEPRARVSPTPLLFARLRGWLAATLAALGKRTASPA